MENSIVILFQVLCSVICLTSSVCKAQGSVRQQHEYRDIMEQPYVKHRLANELLGLTDTQRDSLIDDVRAFSPSAILDAMSKNRLGVNVSSLCANQTLYMLSHAKSKWATEMIDSWGKPPRGILEGNFNWIGAFDECLSVSVVYNTSLPRYLNFSTRYCTISKQLSIAQFDSALSLDVCLPDGCVADDAAGFVNFTLLLLNKSTEGISAACQITNEPLSGSALATIVVCSLVLLLCLIATCYEIIPTWVQDLQMKSSLITEVRNINKDSDQSEYSPLLAKPALKPIEPSPFTKALQCFSLYENGAKLLSTEQPAESLTCLHGIRVLSLTWVILGHTGAFSANTVANPLEIINWQKRWTFQAIENATVSVDSFFVLSGLLTAYILLREFEKKNTSVGAFFKSLPRGIAHRYIRLTPAYAFMVLVWTCLVWYMWKGPMWPTVPTMDTKCWDHWWLNFLYVNNLYISDFECAGWTWYLANDMQFFIMTPFLMYLAFRHPKAGVTTIAALTLASVGACIGVAVKMHAGMGLTVLIPGQPDQYNVYYYYAPWCRFMTYGVGLFVGYILWRLKGQLKISLYTNLLLWATSAVVCILVLYGPFDAESGGHVPTLGEKAVYASVGRFAWSIGLGYVIIACCTGRGGFVNTLLSWPGFLPFSKISYCAYLLHPIVIKVFAFGSRDVWFYTDLTFIGLFLTYVIVTFMSAFVFSILFEAPIMGLDKLFLTPKKSH